MLVHERERLKRSAYDLLSASQDGILQGWFPVFPEERHLLTRIKD
jgi:hypothetical protein